MPLYSETDDEAEAGEKKDEEDAPKEDERPPMYNCTNIGVCGGFENDIDNTTCVVCEAPRPPMDELIEEYKAKKKAEKAEARAAAAAEANDDGEGEEEGEPLHHLRLRKLQRDLRHVISADQRKIALQRLEEARKDKEKQEEREKAEKEEAKRKAEEEAAEKKEGGEGDKQQPAQPEENSKKEDDPKPKASSPAAAKEEKDSDASPEEDDMIDLDNLPEDRHERLRLLGVDQSLIEEGGDFLDMIE